MTTSPHWISSVDRKNAIEDRKQSVQHLKPILDASRQVRRHRISACNLACPPLRTGFVAHHCGACTAEQQLSQTRPGRCTKGTSLPRPDRGRIYPQLRHRLPDRLFTWFPQIGRAHVLNSSHLGISYAVFCLKKKKTK